MEEQFCSICKNENKESTNNSNSTVLIICENCLKSDQLSPMLDDIFLA